MIGYCRHSDKPPKRFATLYRDTALQALLTNNVGQGASFESHERQDRLVTGPPGPFILFSFTKLPEPASKRNETMFPLSLPAHIIEPPLSSQANAKICGKEKKLNLVSILIDLDHQYCTIKRKASVETVKRIFVLKESSNFTHWVLGR